MLFKYILVFIIINSAFTSSIAESFKKRHRRLKNHHPLAAKYQFQGQNTSIFSSTENVNTSSSLVWSSEKFEGTPTTNPHPVKTTKQRKVSTLTSAKPRVSPPYIDKSFADFKTSYRAIDPISKMRLKKVIVKEIVEVDKIFEYGSSGITSNQWKEKKPTLKVSEYLYEESTTHEPSIPKGFTSSATYKPQSTSDSSIDNVNVTRPVDENVTSLPSTSRPPHKSDGFEKFLKAIFNSLEKHHKSIEHPRMEATRNRSRDDDDVRIDMEMAMDLPEMAEVPSSIPPPLPECDDDDSTTSEDEDQERVETKIVEDDTIIETKYNDEDRRSTDMLFSEEPPNRPHIKNAFKVKRFGHDDGTVDGSVHKKRKACKRSAEEKILESTFGTPTDYEVYDYNTDDTTYTPSSSSNSKLD